MVIGFSYYFHKLSLTLHFSHFNAYISFNMSKGSLYVLFFSQCFFESLITHSVISFSHFFFYKPITPHFFNFNTYLSVNMSKGRIYVFFYHFFFVFQLSVLPHLFFYKLSFTSHSVFSHFPTSTISLLTHLHFLSLSHI